MSQSTNSQSGIWHDVVTVQQGVLLPNPWAGLSPTHPTDPLLNAPTVNLPLNTILGAGPQGKNLELSFEWIDQGVTHTRFFQGFNLEESFNLSKDSGTMSAVSVQVKINEDDTPIVLTGRPYGNAVWEWSFATQNYDAFEEDLHFNYSELSLLVTSQSVPDNTAGIIFYRPNATTNVADQSSTWTDLKIKVKLYNGAAYPGFEQDEQDWTNFESYNLSLNQNSLDPSSFSDDRPLDGKIGNTKVVIPSTVAEGGNNFFWRILWDINHIEIGQFWYLDTQFRDTNHFRGTISNLKLSLHGNYNSSGEWNQTWPENTTGAWQISHLLEGDRNWGSYNSQAVWGTQIPRGNSYETNDAFKILTDAGNIGNNNNGFSVEATVNPRDLTGNSVIVARWTNIHNGIAGDFLVLQIGQRLGFKFMVKYPAFKNEDMVFVVSQNVLQEGIDQRIKVRWHSQNYVHGNSASNLIEFFVDDQTVPHEVFDPAISALSNSIFASPPQDQSSYNSSDSINVASYITNNKLTPQNVDAGWDTYLTGYEQGDPMVHPRTATYFLNNSGSSDPPFFTKYLTTPGYPIVEHRNHTLSDQTGDIYVNPPRSPDSAIVVRVTIPQTAYYKIEEMWVWPIHHNENKVALSVYTGPASGNTVTSHGRYEFVGYDVTNVVTSHSNFLEQYGNNPSNNSINLDERENGSYLYFVVENADTSLTTSAAALLRFQLKRYDGTGIPSVTVAATVTATGAPLKIIPNINLKKLN
jgi:hypothetical protein